MIGAVGALFLLLLSSAGVANEADPAYRVVASTRSHDELLSGAAAVWEGANANRIEWGAERYRTSFEALWNDMGLYVRFRATDPAPWHTYTQRDDPLWDEEVVEIFLDLDRSGRDYAEIEVSPANVVCDVRMVSPSPDKEMDLSWDLVGLESRVDVDPTGWTSTAYLPWEGLRSLPSASNVSLPPKADDRWRFNVFRIERPYGPEKPNRNVVFSAWSRPSGASFHEPAVFRDFVFERE
jgi:hypothetical protein